MDGHSSVDVTQSECDLPDFNQSEHQKRHQYTHPAFELVLHPEILFYCRHVFFILLIIGGCLEFLISSLSSVMIIFKSVSSSRRVHKFLDRNKVFDISILTKPDKVYETSNRRRSEDEVVAEGFQTINGDVYIHGVYVGTYNQNSFDVK